MRFLTFGEFWSAIALPHVAFIAFILILSALCLHCVNIVSTSPSIWQIFDIFSLVQDLGFLEFQDRNLLWDFHSPDDKMPRLCGLTLRRTINDGADNHDDVFKGRFTSAVVKSLQMM